MTSRCLSWLWNVNKLFTFIVFCEFLPSNQSNKTLGMRTLALADCRKWTLKPNSFTYLFSKWRKGWFSVFLWPVRSDDEWNTNLLGQCSLMMMLLGTINCQLEKTAKNYKEWKMYQMWSFSMFCKITFRVSKITVRSLKVTIRTWKLHLEFKKLKTTTSGLKKVLSDCSKSGSGILSLRSLRRTVLVKWNRNK